MAESKEITTNMSESFVSKIVKEGVGNPDFSVTPVQRNLIQGYFVAMDHTLTQQGIPWKDVCVDYKLAQDLMVCAQMGFDMRTDGMLYAVPRKDGKAGGKYRFTIQKGYMGRVFEAMKYAQGKVLSIDVHLVYENDEFTPHFRDFNYPYDTFEYNPPKNCFVDRGKLVGGFAYISYENEKQNKLVVMSKADIDKRKDVAASQAIWTKWYEEMATKTLYIAAAKAVPKDPSKIDSTYRAAQVLDQEQADTEALQNIAVNQETGEVIDLTARPQAIPESTQVDIPAAVKVPVAEKAAAPKTKKAVQEDFSDLEF